MISFSGGTLINEGKCNIEGSNFTGNKAKNGGAIFNNGELSCNNCIFESNKSYEDKIGSKWVGGFGGAIYANSRLILTNTEFNGNNSTDGGALYLKGDCDVEKCIFSKNYCERGGAIRNNSNLNIFGCNFKNNHVKIIFPEDDHDLYGTGNEQHFESDLMGASIYNDNAGNIELFDSIFEGYQSDVIYNDGNIYLKECGFEEDHKIKNNYGQLNIHENEN